MGRIDGKGNWGCRVSNLPPQSKDLIRTSISRPCATSPTRNLAGLRLFSGAKTACIRLGILSVLVQSTRYRSWGRSSTCVQRRSCKAGDFLYVHLVELERSIVVGIHVHEQFLNLSRIARRFLAPRRERCMHVSGDDKGARLCPGTLLSPGPRAVSALTNS